MSQYRHAHAAHPLTELVECALARNPFLIGRSLRVELDAGRIVLRGVVGSYYQKQIAQESVRTIDGVDGVRNELEVISA